MVHPGVGGGWCGGSGTKSGRLKSAPDIPGV